MAETLDEISGGRVILGLGAGWNEPEFTSYGIPFGDQFDRFEDTLRIVTDMFCDVARSTPRRHDDDQTRIGSARTARAAP